MSDLQASIMNGVCWNLRGHAYDTPDTFDKAVRQYHMDIIGDTERWTPDELVVPRSAIVVDYEGLNREAMALDERSLELKASTPGGFTALDLLFQLHNAVFEELSEIDHSFFEGFRLVASTADAKVPHYRLCQGS